jgi:two-component system, OmpR family, sensor histidine kinase KdpD
VGISRRPLGRLGATLLGVALVAGTAALLVPFRARTSTATDALALVVPVVVAAWAGGRLAALVTAAVAAATLEVFFLPPYNTFKIDLVDDAVALGVFTAVALAVGTLVAAEGERRRLAEQRAAEIEALYERERGLLEAQQRLTEEAAQLQQLGDDRSALLRSVSHDLRTPLVTIKAVTSDLRDGTDYDDAVRDELLDLVGDEAERLDRLVANLLSLSRVESGSLTPDRQALSLDELLTDRVRKLNRVLRNVRVQMDVPFTLPLADGDYTLVDQVVTNLLENAARHSPDGGTVRVRAREQGGWIEVSVSDQGPGVDPEDRDRIFEPFSRGKGSTSSGVGLAICKAIVEAHGGSIAVQSSEANGRGGATFVFTLPVHRQ